MFEVVLVVEKDSSVSDVSSSFFFNALTFEVIILNINLIYITIIALFKRCWV